MKTWICTVFGGGTPLYLVSAESEKRAWQLIGKELNSRYRNKYFINKRNDTGGLVELDGWTSVEERIVDLEEVYAPNGTIKKGSYEGLD